MIQKGDIGFVITTNNIFSRIFAWFMNSQWSHTFVVINDKETIETDMIKVHINTLSDHIDDKNKNLEIWSPICSQEHREIIYEEAKKLLGIKYGYFKMIMIGVRRLIMKLGIKIGLLYSKGTICSDVPIAGLVKSGLLNTKNIDTQELYENIIKSGYVLILKIKH
jgi:hypothetical protein